MTIHICRQRPGFKAKTDDPWADGTAAACAYHNKQGKTQTRILGINEKRARDKSAGVVGTQRSGYISGSE